MPRLSDDYLHNICVRNQTTLFSGARVSYAPLSFSAGAHAGASLQVASAGLEGEGEALDARCTTRCCSAAVVAIRSTQCQRRENRAVSFQVLAKLELTPTHVFRWSGTNPVRLISWCF
jgi:hypothetical protein